jgi:NADPH2:quinone reductase
MKAVLIKDNSKKIYHENSATPKINENQILVQNLYAGLNFLDIYIKNAAGTYAPKAYPAILGREGVGKVVELGKKVSGIKKGQVIGYISNHSGSFAEFSSVDATSAIKIPTYIDAKIAVASFVQGMTAIYLTEDTYRIKKGTTCLIHAGSGGVGGLLIQIAKLKGARVITTVSNDAKAKIAKKLGADVVLNYTEFQNLAEKVDVVYDAVGKDTFLKGLELLKTKGLMVNYGQSSGAVPAFELSLLSKNSLFLTRPSLFHYVEGKQLQKTADKLFKLIKEKKLAIQIGLEVPLDKIEQGFDALENRKTSGKVLIKL